MNLISVKSDGETLALSLSGRVDSSNADQFKSEADAAIQTPHERLILDMDGLLYISSAGLRVILHLRKLEPSLKVINASAEVYEIFEMTGFTEMIPVEKGYRKLSVDGLEVIGRGAKGTVYRQNAETIIKVYNDPDSIAVIRRERELARRAFVLGVPTAISYDVVKVGDLFGSVFELLDSNPLSAFIAQDPQHVADYAKTAAELLRQIHETQVEEGDMPAVKERIVKWCSETESVLRPEDTAALRARIEAVPDTMQMLHCDFHSNNIMMQDGEALLIDMDTLAHGHPIFDLANTRCAYKDFVRLGPGVVDAFLSFSAELASRFWDAFLSAYLQTDDPARVAEVDAKVELLSTLRLLRHIVRRGVKKPEEQSAVDYCVARIPELLQSVTSLTF